MPKTLAQKKIEKSGQKQSSENGRFLALYDYEELFPGIVDRLSNGEDIKKICSEDGLPEYTGFRRWLRKNPEYLAEYNLAKTDKAEGVDSEIIDIKDRLLLPKDDPNFLEARQGKGAADILFKLKGQWDPRYSDTNVKHTHEAGASMRAFLTEKKQRAEDRLKQRDIEGVEYEEVT